MRSFEEYWNEHGDVYGMEIAEDAWDYQQSKVDELQKKNAWLSDVAERENKRANKLQEEKVSTTVLLGKTIQEKMSCKSESTILKTLSKVSWREV